MAFTETLLARIVAHCALKGMTEREFGLTVAGNHKFVSRLRQGHGVNSLSIDRVEALMAGKPMPARVSRPKRISQAETATA